MNNFLGGLFGGGSQAAAPTTQAAPAEVRVVSSRLKLLRASNRLKPLRLLNR